MLWKSTLTDTPHCSKINADDKAILKEEYSSQNGQLEFLLSFQPTIKVRHLGLFSLPLYPSISSNVPPAFLH